MPANPTFDGAGARLFREHSLSKFEWFIVGGSVAIWVLIIAGGHMFLADDVFFYLRIADGIVSGQGSTFNGITPTNGYHPLWMLFCVGIRTLVSDREHFVRALLFLCAALQIPSLLLLSRWLRHGGVTTRWPALLVLGCFLVTLPPGSEFHISIPLLLLMLDRATMIHRRAATAREYAILGVVAGFAMLARLDNVFLVSAVVLAVAFHAGGAHDILRALLFIGIPATLIVSPYLAWNVLSFGALVPISGVVKTTFAKPGIAKLGARGLCISLAALTLPFASPRPARIVTRTARLVTMTSSLLPGAMTLGAAAHITYVVVRMSSVWQWYYASEILAASLAASLWAERVVGWSRIAPAAHKTAAVVIAAALLSAAAFQRAKELQGARGSRDWYIDAARVIDETVAPGDSIATTMSPGGIGYYCHRGVFAFDGLTLDYAFHREALREGLATYLQRHHVAHLLAPSPDSSQADLFVRLTRAQGQVEGTAYYAGPNGHTVNSLEVFSSLLGQSLGRFDLTRLYLERRNFCVADVAIWRLD